MNIGFTVDYKRRAVLTPESQLDNNCDAPGYRSSKAENGSERNPLPVAADLASTKSQHAPMPSARQSAMCPMQPACQVIEGS